MGIITSLHPALKTILEQNIRNQLEIFQDIKGSKNSLTKFATRWGGDGDPYNFIHGYIMGDLQGSTMMTARTILGRPLTDVERTELVTMIDNIKDNVSDLIARLKNA